MIARFALLTSLGFAALTAASPRPPNVLLIVADDQPPDTIRALGNRAIETPSLDRLVRDGASFRRAITANPLCVPSRAEILTGASGFRNGSPPFGGAIDPAMVHWATAMRQAGYNTWYSGKWMNDGTPQTRGYEETRGLFSGGGAAGRPLTVQKAYHGRAANGYNGWTFKTNAGVPELEKGVGLTPLTDRHIADAAIGFIERRPDRPFFLHVNFTAPHFPLHFPPGYEKKYDPATIPLPPNFLPEHPFDHGNRTGGDEDLLPLPRHPDEVRANIAAVYAVISHLDAQVGRLREALRATGKDRDTIIIFTSDHGMANGSHGLMGKQNMYEHTIGVPLILAGPGLPRDRRFPAQVYLRDLYPTVCELAGVPIPATVEGRSFGPVLAGLAQEIHPEVYAYWHKPTPGAEPPVQRMVRTERWKLITYSHLNRRQLFDLADDPHELRDLSSQPEHRVVLAELQQKLDAWFTPRIKSAGLTAGPPAKP